MANTWDSDQNYCISGGRKRIYIHVGLMLGSATILSVAIIMFFNSVIDEDRLTHFGSELELAAVTLMPYMIVAVVAAITSIGVMSVFPLIGISGSARSVRHWLREVAAGDLSTRIKPTGEATHIANIAIEFNNTVAALGNDIASWKLINRQQWEILQTIRQAGLDKNIAEVLQGVDKMEKNWAKIADVEERWIT